MMRQSQGKMFLADERGITETAHFRIISTFNFGQYQQQHKQPFGALLALNECTLGGKQTRTYDVTGLIDVIIIPVVGGVEITDGDAEPQYIEAGTISAFNLREGERYHIRNPFDTDLVKYLELHVVATQTGGNIQQQFDLDANRLVPIFSKEAFKLSMVKMQGRQEDNVHVTNAANGLFFYVIQGACEVEYRLLHAGDGLSLWDIPEAEFEALSADAILLIAEVKIS